MPLRTSRRKIVGVLQLINALGENGKVVPFTGQDQLILNYFADNAGAAMERARLTREVILRMVKMAEMRDPEETGPHVNRVGAYAAEIYHRWARIGVCLRRRSGLPRTCCASPPCCTMSARSPSPT